MIKLVSIFLLLILCNFSFTQDQTAELVTDRPDQTESSVVVPKRSLQIETGFSFTGDKAENVENNNFSIGSTLFRYGLHKNAELRFGVNYDILRVAQANSDSSLQGFTPIELGTKLYIAEEYGFLPEVAFIASLTMPYGSKEFRTKYLAPTLLIAASHTLSESFSLGYNFGALWDGESPEAAGKYSLALGWGATEKLGVYAEVFGTFNRNISGHAFDAGVTYLLKPNIQLDASGGIALNNEADDYYLSCGFTWRIPR